MAGNETDEREYPWGSFEGELSYELNKLCFKMRNCPPEISCVRCPLDHTNIPHTVELIMTEGVR